MQQSPYQQFLEDKLRDQHALTHILEQDVSLSKERIFKLLKDLSAVRRSENELRLKSRQQEEKLVEQQTEIKKLREVRAQRSREATDKRLKQEAALTVDHKQIFKMYLDNTFPKYKGLLKKIMKVLFIIQEHDSKSPPAKVAFYKVLFEEGVKRVLDWLFPKKINDANKKQLAETIVKEWKGKQAKEPSKTEQSNLTLLKQTAYIKQIEALQADILVHHSKVKALEGRLKTYERSMQAKGGQFVAHLKKYLTSSKELEPQSHEYVSSTIELFKNITQLSQQSVKGITGEDKLIEKEAPLILIDSSAKSGHKKRPAPILKKNIFGYYQEPQLAGNYTLPTVTKHQNLNKATQTLSEDLCVLTLHPVIMVTLIDGNIKPIRTRHSQQHYVRIKVNEESQVDSVVKEGMQPVWNQPFLLKDYDFPFINIQLMHKIKGLRDYALGGGKLSASCEEEKIVNVRKEKEFMGRVRFSLSYPKGNVYQFRITSVLLEIPQGKHLLKETVNIQFPYNPLLPVQFDLPQKVVYLERSVVILENCEQCMEVAIPKQDLKGQLQLNAFTAKEGHKEVLVTMEGWKVIIQGQVYLLISEQSQPERINKDLLEGGQGKFLSVRAPPPIVTVTYDKLTLHANIKFPLVFQLRDANTLSIVKELSNRELEEQVVDPLTNSDGQLRLDEAIKAPRKIYKFFIETLEGQQVYLKHESHLFERLLKEVTIRVSYKEDEVQEINYNRKGKKEKDKLYKEFVIETKLLMLNHYKVFSRHFKRIGFLKFKLGYTIYDNQLLTESADKPKLEVDYSIQEGQYFLSLELASAHLHNLSNSSSYSCKLNSQQSKQIKGNQPVWKEGFTFDFFIKDSFELEIPYQITEHGTLSTKVVYSGTIVITQKVLQMEALIVSLGEEGDCLHFNSIRIPQSVYHFVIDSIEADIEEEADWIGKIDPYLTISSQNRQLHRTQYLDNIGSHPVWNNINQKIIIGSQSTNEEEDIISCQIHDYDPIGRDDYIGEVSIGTKLNPELLNSGKSQLLHGSIVKDNSTCGGLKLRGKFQKLIQKKVVFRPKSTEKLSRKDLVYRLVIHKLSFESIKDFQEEKGWINYIRQEDRGNTQQERERIVEFSYVSEQLTSIDAVVWQVGQKQLQFEVYKQYKSLFKSTVQKVGAFKVQVTDKRFKCGQADIIGQKGQHIGHCLYYVQVLSSVRYSIISGHTCCRKDLSLVSDLEHRIFIRPEKSNETQLIFYHKRFTAQSQNEGKYLSLSLSSHKQQTFKVIHPFEGHPDQVCFLKVQQGLTYETTIEEESLREKAKLDKQFKAVKHIHWEPYQYKESQQYKLDLSSEKGQTLELHQKMSSVYNNYLVLHDQATPIVFDAKNIPDSITITNMSSQQQEKIKLSNSEEKIFVPKKGALYYQLEDYNQKSILEVQFSYLFLKVNNIEKLKQFSSVKAHLSTPLTVKKFTCGAVRQNCCFLFERISLCIAESPKSGTLFFSGYLQGSKLQDQGLQRFLEFQFGLRMQSNREQYRYVESGQVIVHAQMASCLVERKYDPAPPVDNTLYGMSFIQLTSLSFQISEDPPSNQVSLELVLNNQHERLQLQRVPDSNIYTAETGSVFFVEPVSTAEFLLTEEGILSSTTIGKASIELSQAYVLKEEVTFCSEVRKNSTIIGKLEMRYTNKREVEFVDVNMFTHITRPNQPEMQASLQQFGPNKEKYQSISLTSKGKVSRLESEDSFIVTEDPREYQINISQKDSQKLLGEFKLFHELNNAGDRVTVIQPLRTSSSALNGVLIIQYEKKRSNSVSLDRNKGKSIHLIELSLFNLTFKKHYNKLKDDISVNLRTHARNLTTRPMPISKVGLQKPFLFNILSNQSGQLSLLKKQEPFCWASVRSPYLDGEERMVILEKDGLAVGVACMRVREVRDKDELAGTREVVSVQARDLMDTEYFVKMKPYIEVQALSKDSWPVYISDLGLGRESIFWKMNIITEHSLNFTFKDKDMFFDDLIGNAVLPVNQGHQQKERMDELVLYSSEGDNRKGGNGTIKVMTLPITVDSQAQQLMVRSIRVSWFILRVAGLSEKMRSTIDDADCLEVSMGSPLDKHIIFRACYKKDMFECMRSRELSVETDTAFLPSGSSAAIVTLYQRGSIKAEQVINLGTQQTQKSPQQIFTICQLIPIQRQLLSLSKVYCWLFYKLNSSVQVYVVGQHTLKKMQVLASQNRIVVAQPSQLIQEQEVTLIGVSDDSELFRVPINFNEGKDRNISILCRPIMNTDKEEVGICYAQLRRFYSEGLDQEVRTVIGRSNKQWLCLTIEEATLTKDLELFSKMDPYCRFYITKEPSQEINWHRTSVQQNVGLRPIWKETFILQIKQQEIEQSSIRFEVMDSEVTVDRLVGKVFKKVSELIDGPREQHLQIQAGEKESAGKLKLKWSITKECIVIRSIEVREGVRSRKITFVHEENPTSREGRVVEEGSIYPLSKDTPAILSCGNQVKRFSSTDLKEMTGRTIVFEEECCALTYDFLD